MGGKNMRDATTTWGKISNTVLTRCAMKAEMDIVIELCNETNGGGLQLTAATLHSLSHPRSSLKKRYRT